MKYFLDTNIISYVIKGKFPELKKHFREIKAGDIYIPSVVVAEIEYGASKSSDYRKTIDIYKCFINTFQTVSFSAKSALYYGNIRAQLEKQGQLIGANDLLIAATVLSEKGILVTNNVSEFSRIPNLKIENWTK